VKRNYSYNHDEQTHWGEGNSGMNQHVLNGLYNQDFKDFNIQSVRSTTPKIWPSSLSSICSVEST
jgi:hypothetical protein